MKEIKDSNELGGDNKYKWRFLYKVRGFCLFDDEEIVVLGEVRSMVLKRWIEKK